VVGIWWKAHVRAWCVHVGVEVVNEKMGSHWCMLSLFVFVKYHENV